MWAHELVAKAAELAGAAYGRTADALGTTKMLAPRNNVVPAAAGAPLGVCDIPARRSLPNQYIRTAPPRHCLADGAAVVAEAFSLVASRSTASEAAAARKLPCLVPVHTSLVQQMLGWS